MKREIRVTSCDRCEYEYEGKPATVLQIGRKRIELCGSCSSMLDDFLLRQLNVSEGH